MPCPQFRSLSVNSLRPWRDDGKSEIACADELVDRVVEGIQSTARTGQIGDGKVFVLDLERAVRIRTGESGDEAL